MAFILTARKGEMESLASGATFKEISKENFCSIQIPLVPIDKQREFVKEIEGYRKIIAGARQINNNYKSTIPIKSSWPTVKIEGLFDVVADTVDPANEIGTVLYVGLKNIESVTGRIIGQLECEIEAIKSVKRVFKSADILFGKLRPALNKVAFPDINGICSTDIIVLRAKNKNILPEFYSILMRKNDFNTMVLNGVSGGQLLRVDSSFLLALPIPLVPLEEQQRILDEIRAERALTEPTSCLIDLFNAKIKNIISEVWHEAIT